MRIEYGQPTRSAITVAGIRGNARSSSRIRGSYSSTSNPAGARSYLGGPSLANAAFTVFREQPTTRAISEIDTPSDLRSRRISAQSSTISTCFLPGSTPARVTRELVNFQLPHRGQYSVAVDSAMNTTFQAGHASSILVTRSRASLLVNSLSVDSSYSNTQMTSWITGAMALLTAVSAVSPQRINAVLRETFERTGASLMGKRMFDAGEQAWPEEAPFHTPVFVVTHTKRDPWERPGGTTFHFVNDGIEPALDQAREAAGDRDVRIAGGGATILEYVNPGLIDEFSIALSPVLFGSGIRLFEGVDAGRVALEPVRAEPSPRVTHLTYAVRPP